VRGLTEYDGKNKNKSSYSDYLIGGKGFVGGGCWRDEGGTTKKRRGKGKKNNSSGRLTFISLLLLKTGRRLRVVRHTRKGGMEGLSDCNRRGRWIALQHWERKF